MFRSYVSKLTFTLISLLNNFRIYLFRKTVFGTRRSFSPNIPINALELNGPSIIEFSAENQLHEWAIYLSARQILFWRDGLINTKRMDQIYRKCR